MLIDMIVVFIYLLYIFGLYEGFIIIVIVVVFLYIVIWMILKFKFVRRGEVSVWFKEYYVR